MRHAEEQEEFSAFVHARTGPLFRTAYLLTGDASLAEDLVLATLAKVYPRWHRIVAGEPPEGYALRLLVAGAAGRWHRDRAHHMPAGAGGAMNSRAVDSRAVWNVVLGLHPRQRAAVVLRYHEGLSEEEAADALGVAVGTVRHLVDAADRRLSADRHLLAGLACATGPGAAVRAGPSS